MKKGQSRTWCCFAIESFDSFRSILYCVESQPADTVAFVSVGVNDWCQSLVLGVEMQIIVENAHNFGERARLSSSPASIKSLRRSSSESKNLEIKS